MLHGGYLEYRGLEAKHGLEFEVWEKVFGCYLGSI